MFKDGRENSAIYRAPGKVRRDWSQKPNVLQVDGASEINAEHQLAVESASGAIKHAIKCGELLTEQKSRLKHGEFGPWIAKHCKFSQATANNYMKAAQNPNAVGNSVRHLYESGRQPKQKKRGADSKRTHADAADVCVFSEEGTKIALEAEAKREAKLGDIVRSRNSPDSVYEDTRERGHRRISVDSVIEDVLSDTEAKFANIWHWCEPHISALSPAKVAEFRRQAIRCGRHISRLLTLLKEQEVPK
jgi:hypothetical protein